jgi:hypothetical protein
VEFNCAVHAPFFAAAYYLGGWFTRVKCGDTSGTYHGIFSRLIRDHKSRLNRYLMKQTSLMCAPRRISDLRSQATLGYIFNTTGSHSLTARITGYTVTSLSAGAWTAMPVL